MLYVTAVAIVPSVSTSKSFRFNYFYFHSSFGCFGDDLIGPSANTSTNVLQRCCTKPLIILQFIPYVAIYIPIHFGADKRWNYSIVLLRGTGTTYFLESGRGVSFSGFHRSIFRSLAQHTKKNWMREDGTWISRINHAIAIEQMLAMQYNSRYTLTKRRQNLKRALIPERNEHCIHRWVGLRTQNTLIVSCFVTSSCLWKLEASGVQHRNPMCENTIFFYLYSNFIFSRSMFGCLLPSRFSRFFFSFS